MLAEDMRLLGQRQNTLFLTAEKIADHSYLHQFPLPPKTRVCVLGGDAQWTKVDMVHMAEKYPNALMSWRQTF